MAEEEIVRNIAQVRQQIAQAADRVGRSAETITLVAVTKTVPVPRIAAAAAAGLRDFGESYVQEALAKVGAVELDREDVRWHFIGHLQRNKVRQVVGRFALIHSVDSLELAQTIGRQAQQAGELADTLLEVKLDPAATKFGILPEAVRDTAARTQEIAGIRLRGLMGMAPFSAEAEAARPYFRQLYRLFEQLPPEARQTLSMGMSGDFPVAVEEGATLVRIGTAIFGKRP